MMLFAANAVFAPPAAGRGASEYRIFSGVRRMRGTPVFFILQNREQTK